ILENGSHSDEIVCHLKSANLEERPSYVALSYVWGDPSIKVLITCIGRQLTVRANLASALRRLREASNWGIFWVDALCINQADVAERNTQVRIMRDIYGQARLVAAHIG
ncbi:heterokaryon incompatibility protein-domain-containing protein, partial [Halenospora varia]